MILTTRDVFDVWKGGSDARKALAYRETYWDGDQRIAELQETRIDGVKKSATPANWVRYAVRMHTGFMLLNPVSYVLNEVDDVSQAALKEWQRISALNNLAAVDSRHFGNALLYGYSVEVVAFNGVETAVRGSLPPTAWELVRNSDGGLEAAIARVELAPFTVFNGSLERKPRTLFYVYSPEGLQVMEQKKEGKEPVESGAFQANPTGQMPVVVYTVQEDGDPFISRDFLKQCDAFDVARGSMDDDIKLTVDALLALKNMDYKGLLEEDEHGVTVLKKLRDAGVLPLPKDAEASYLQRTVDVQKFVQSLKITRQQIHLMGCLPDLDETVAGGEGTITNISGIALKLMFHPMIQVSAEFERCFSIGLRQRVALVNRLNSPLRRPALENFTLNFRRNIPQNEMELVQYLPNLVGTLSQRDRIELLPFIDSPEQALQRAKDEEREKAAAAAPPAAAPPVADNLPTA